MKTLIQNCYRRRYQILNPALKPLQLNCGGLTREQMDRQGNRLEIGQRTHRNVVHDKGGITNHCGEDGLLIHSTRITM